MTYEGISDFKLQKGDKHSRISYKEKFSMGSLALSCFICALNQYWLKSCSE